MPDVLVEPGAAALVATGYVPAVLAPAVQVPGVAALVLTGQIVVTNVVVTLTPVGVSSGVFAPFAGAPYGVTVIATRVGTAVWNEWSPGTDTLDDLSVVAVRNVLRSAGGIIGAISMPYAVTVVIDSGASATANPGNIFQETAATALLTDTQIADALGVHYSVIRNIRGGVPDWRFAAVSARFASLYGYDPNLLRGAFAGMVARQNRPATPWGQVQSAREAQYFGLRDAPTAGARPLPSDPYNEAWVPITTGFDAVPGTSSGLVLPAGVPHDALAWHTHIEVTGGRVYATFDGREVSVFSHDAIIGTMPTGGGAGASGGQMRIDEFEPGDGFDDEDAERFALFGFARAVGGTPDTAVSTRELRVHPSKIRLMSPDSAATYKAAIYQVGDRIYG